MSDQQHADERCCSVRQNRVVLTPRRWRQVRGVASAQPGLDKTYPLMTVAKEPGHRGERDISRKTIACGNAGRFRCTRCYSCAFCHYKGHTRPRVQRAPGIPHALFWARDKCTARAHRAARLRGCVCNWSRDEECVPRMLRNANAISAFTRVFDALCLAAWCAADPGPLCTPHCLGSRLCGAS